MPEKKGISLLPREIKREKERKARNRLLRRASLVFLGISSLIGVLVLSCFFFLNRRLDNLNKEIAKEKSKIASLSTVESTAYELDVRTKSLKSVLANTPYFSTLLAEILSAVPSDVKVTEMNVASEKEAAVSGISKSYASLAQFLRALKGSGEEGLFDAVELKAVSLDQQTGEAKFDLNLRMREGVLRR